MKRRPPKFFEKPLREVSESIAVAFQRSGLKRRKINVA
jgi:hypothetical protein